MKKEHRFKEGDKVFAKVKGYPPWPAIVLEDNVKKYKVKFYGTGEIGQIKQEDLFYYVRNKEKLLKPSKRKDFQDSIVEIEEAIKDAGTDGDPGNEVVREEDANVNDSTINENETAKKRKRSASVSKPANKKIKPTITKSRSSSPISDVTNDAQITIEEDTKETKPEIENEVEEIEVDEKPEETPTTSPVEPEMEIKKPQIKDFVLDKELEAFITFGDHVGNHKEIYTNMPVEPRLDSELQILPFVKEKLPIGVKLHKTWPLKTFENEYERAIYDKEISQFALDVKQSFNMKDLTDTPSLFFTDLEFSEDDLEKIYSDKLISIKEEILKKLSIESTLLEYDAKIKNCLNLDKAEPKEAILLLEEMLKLNLDKIMLKKHAHVVDMVRRLRKYIGNMESWNLSDEEKKTFRKDAEEIRKNAMKVYVKFMHIIGKPPGVEIFWDAFNDIATKFREETKELSEAEYYMLSSEPYSRKNFLTTYFIKDIPLNIPIQNSVTKDSENNISK